MHLLFDIFQGIGIAAAVGIRPFLPVVAVGALAAGDVNIGFEGTDFSFLESTPWLLAMVLCAIALALVERRLGQSKIERPPPSWSWLRSLSRSARSCLAARWHTTIIPA